MNVVWPARSCALRCSPGSVPVSLCRAGLAPPRLDLAAVLDDARGTAFHLAFDGFPTKGYAVFASTNLADWSWLGAATETAPGRFAFSDFWRVPDGQGGWVTHVLEPIRVYRIGFYQQVQTP